MDNQSFVNNAGEADAANPQRQHRKRALKKAHAAFNAEFSAVPCVVRNHNEDGALLEFIDPILVPEKFMLHIEIDAKKMEVERRWQKGRQVGVQFTSDKLHTEAGRDQVVQPSENRLVSAQERAAELQRKLDEARHQGILQRAALEADTNDEVEDGSNDQPTSDEPKAANPGQMAQPVAQVQSENQTLSSPVVAPTQVSTSQFSPDSAPLTERIPIQENRLGVDRRAAARGGFGRRPADKKPLG